MPFAPLSLTIVYYVNSLTLTLTLTLTLALPPPPQTHPPLGLIPSSNVQFSYNFLKQRKTSYIPPKTALQATLVKETGKLRPLRYRLIESN